jgi:membrane AbrB-like protein
MVSKTWTSYIWTPLVGILGGLLASAIHWPLPWMIGALVAVVLVRCFSPWKIAATPGGRKAGQWVVGIGIGLHFNALVVEHVLAHLIPILAGALITTAVGAIGVWWMRYSGEERATAFFASMPGGSAEMVNLAQRNAAALHRVAAAQTLRVMIVVLTIPAVFKLLVGVQDIPTQHGALNWTWMLVLLPCGGVLAWLLQKIRKPNPWMFGPLIVSASASIVFDLHIVLPPGASEFGQLMIGSSLGCYFDRSFFRDAPAFLARSFVATCLMILAAFLAAIGVGWIAGIDFRSLTLGMMPGGIAEMSLTAETLRLAVPLVTTMQTLRLVLVMTFAERVYRYWSRIDDK